jgi:hypothetical protein
VKLKGLYRESIGSQVEDRHGGVKIVSTVWRYFCFYGDERVGSYTAGEEHIKLYFNYDLLSYKGEIIYEDDHVIKLYLEDSSGIKRTNYSIRCVSGSDVIYVEKDAQTDSDNIPHSTEFKKIELDFDLIALTRAQVNILHTLLLDHNGKETDLRVFKGDELEVLGLSNNLIKVAVFGLKKKSGWLRREDIKFWSEP